MVGLTFPPEMRGQFGAVAKVRWQLFINSLRTLRGRLELVSRVLVGLAFAFAGLGGSFGLAIGVWFLVTHGKAQWVAAPLWPIFLFWQMFPVMATAFTENFDSSNLLRFPLSYPSYFLIRLFYGSLDPATALGSLWLLGITCGIGFAAPRQFLWAALVLLAFAGFNILLGRMIFAWIERWLAQRRTREILGIVFFLFIIAFQFVGPLTRQFGNRPHPGVEQFGTQLLQLERLLPPGLAGASISHAILGEYVQAAGAFGLLAAYGLAMFRLLNVRVRAQYHGENLSEAIARTNLPKERQAPRLGWNLPGISGPVTAIVEKEFRYLSRSGPMLFTMIMPVVILFIFRLTPSNSGNGNPIFGRAADLAFPVGAAYSLLVLTNLVYNNFGADGVGVQMFFVAPVRFRDILLAKNLTHAGVMTLETMAVWVAVCFLFQPPSLEITLITLAGLAFALPTNLGMGNLFSIYSPKKIDFGTFGRQRASGITALASFGVQIGVGGLAAITLLTARAYERIWIGSLILLVFAGVAVVGYALVLNRAEGIALARREVMISELSRA